TTIKQKRIKMLPNFVHAGVPKSGSGTFRWIFKHHPEIYVPKVKEQNFFNLDRSYKKGLNWYEATHYKQTGNATAVGDLSIGYSTGLGIRAPERIYQSLGEGVKIIFTFRHPVDRAYSQYCMARNKGQFESSSFCNAVKSALAVKEDYSYDTIERLQTGSYYSDAKDLEIYRNCMYLYPGLYNSILNNYLKFFDRQNILCLFSDDISSNLQREANRVFEFLGVEEMTVPNDLRLNQSTTTSNSKMVKIANIFYQNRLIRTIWNDLLPYGTRKRLKRVLISRHYTTNSDRDPIDRETATLLQNYYRNDMLQLAKTTGKNLDEWQSRY
ncbi:sulfotransferase domain-containing protein, partial [Mariniblastus sp.]|nr:sulfotransferase domain-containing protein [Mariniblastus sp.]